MKKNRRIGSKIALIAAASAAIFSALLTAHSYLYLFDPLRDSVMDGRVRAARLAANSIAILMEEQAALVKTSSSAESLIEALIQADEKYHGMDAEGARSYLLDVNKKWLNSSADDPLTRELLENKVSSVLKANEERRPVFFNTLAADRYGGLAGASYRPPSFYYAADDWWQEAFAESKGRVSLGDAVFDPSTQPDSVKGFAQDRSRAKSADEARREFDPSAPRLESDEANGRWSFPLSAVIRDANGAAMGAYKTSVDISAFYKPLRDLELGKGVSAALIDGKGYLIFYPGIKPFSNKFCEYDELRRLFNNKKGWSVIDTAYMADRKTAAAFARVNNPLLSIRGAGLYVVTAEDSGRLGRPLNILAARMGIFSLILALAVLVLAGAVFKRTFSAPLKSLIEGMKFIGDGILDHRVDIKTGDDMEELGTALNGMAESLKRMTTSIKTLDQEKAGRAITERRLERASSGSLSLILELRADLLYMTKALEALRQDADRVGNEKLKKDLDQLSRRANGMIGSMDKEIYAFRLETGAVEFKMEPKDFRDIIKGLIFVFEPKVRAKGLGLKLDIPKSGLVLSIDKDKIKEVFDILIENSLSATEKGSISVSARELNNEIEFSVSDTGEGIREESIGEVFERFSGFSRGKPPEGPMPGPDMFIARLIVEKHNGRIRVESEPGGHTRFILTLPKK